MKYFLFLLFPLVFFVSLFLYQKATLDNGKLQVHVCNVGQGDAVYIRTPGGHNILFDGGPNNSVLSCLSRFMPFWDRTIDLMLLSHPHADHLNGLISVLQRYRVRHFLTEDLANTSAGYKAIQQAVKDEGIPWQLVLAGVTIQTGVGVSLKVLSPDRAFLDRTAVGGKYITSSEFASLIVLVSYKNFSLLLNGDSQDDQLQEALEGWEIDHVVMLQVPHHGSRTGLSEAIMGELHAQVATISVGKNNYGHPSPLTLALLSKAGIPIHRTDREGDISLISDGTAYNLK
jgi:competence protein ComEC